MDYKYKVSVIIPVYNTQQYLEDCLKSLISQTIDKDSIEVLLINDGSTDSSGAICEKYSSEYPYFKYFEQTNSGVSKTRNFGIKNAQGKYIMFLDSDDQLSPSSIESIYSYFEKVYKKTDLVTYFIQPYKNGRPVSYHNRYKKILTHTAVYDLEKYPYIVQTTMNICVKNLGENNFYFNEEMKNQEDQEYINRVLEEKLKIGYCAQACYLYNRDNETSAVSSKFHAYYLFEPSMKYFESLFSKYKDRVPLYYQAMFFHDLRWKLTSKILFPFHYEGKEFENAINRIKNLLSRVDVEIITKNPSISKEHIRFWLSLKPNVFPQHYVSSDGIDIVAEGKTIIHNKMFNIKLLKISELDDGKFRIWATTESSVYDYIDDLPQIYAVENGEKKEIIPVYRSCFSFVQTNMMTNKLYGFTYDIDPEAVNKLSFKTVIDSYEMDVHMTFVATSVFQHKKRRYKYCKGNYFITYFNDSILFEKKSREELYEFEKGKIEYGNDELLIKELKANAIDYRANHRVWLYSDLNTVLKDNAYYQFRNDFSKDDNVERYYVYTKPYEEIEHLFNEEQKEYLIEFGSYKHQLLYLASELIISSFFGRKAISPFITENEEIRFMDICHFRVIYMQHGILHASYVRKYSAERAACDKIVVSSYFEIKNLTEKYHYKDDQLIKCGMPRYSRINCLSQPKGRILLAPSWRSYLTTSDSDNEYNINITSFKASDYYKKFYAFINSKELQKMLEEKDVVLDIKMHPIIKNIVSSLFKTECDRINIVMDDINLEDYNLFITDFSSFVFDFAYLNRPIMYFVPDYMQFKSGMNLYRDLDLPFDEAFGPLSTEVEDAINDIINIANNDFQPEEKYKNRMEKFYLPMGNCEEEIYNYITDTMF